MRAVLRRTLQWGTATGAALGVVVAAVAWLLPAAFSPDPDVRAAVTAGLLVAALFLPVAGWVFVLDGVLIGAGDGRYLAAAGMVTLVAYAPAAWAVGAWAPDGAAGAGLAVGELRGGVHGRAGGGDRAAGPRHPLDGHRRLTVTPTPAPTEVPRPAGTQQDPAPAGTGSCGRAWCRRRGAAHRVVRRVRARRP